MRRGDLVTVILPGDLGKPRPAVVVQSDAVDGFDTVLVCPLTSDVQGNDLVRLVIQADGATGLTATSEAMVEKTGPASRKRLGRVIGRLTVAQMMELDRRLAFVLGLG